MIIIREINNGEITKNELRQWLFGLLSSLKFEIGHPIVPRCVIKGRFTDNSEDELAIGCYDGSVLIYRSDKIEEESPKILSFKEEITCMIVVSWGPKNLDYIAVGSGNSVQVYNVYQNVSIFYKKLDDGLSTLAAGFLSGITESWLMCGGQSSFTGFNSKGEELYWNVASDAINAICFADLINKGSDQAIVGTADSAISVFDAEELADSRTETSPILLLTFLKSNYIGYATENGTAGVYKGLERLWRIKSNSIAGCQTAYKAAHTTEGILTGWMNGRWDLRKLGSGEMIYKNELKSSIAAIITGVFNQSENESVLVYDAQGQLELFTPLDIIKQAEQKDKLQNETIRKLTNQTNAYQLELKSLNEKQAHQNLTIGERASLGIIPGDAKIITQLIHASDGRLLVDIEVTHGLVLFLVILLSDGMFKNSESKIELSRHGDAKMKIPVENATRNKAEICVKASVGYPGSEVLHVLEGIVKVPRFAQFCQINDPISCNQKVEFSISERIQRMILWVNQNFHLYHDLDTRMSELKLHFKSPTECLNICMNNGHVLIETRSMKLASDIVQSMGSYFSFSLLRSICEFDEVRRIPNIFKEIHDIQETFSRMESEIAELSQRAMVHLVRLEDSRVLEYYDAIATTLSSLQLTNDELLQKYSSKEKNKSKIVTLLKALNSVIDSGSKLRIGSPSTEVLSVCRAAVKNRKPEIITNAILHGVQ